MRKFRQHLSTMEDLLRRAKSMNAQGDTQDGGKLFMLWAKSKNESASAYLRIISDLEEQSAAFAVAGHRCHESVTLAFQPVTAPMAQEAGFSESSKFVPIDLIRVCKVALRIGVRMSKSLR